MLERAKLKNLFWLGLSLIVIVLDLYTKHLAVSHLQLYKPIAVTPFFNFTLAYNTGAAFSMLSQAGGWQQWFLGGVALIVSAVILVWLYQLPSRQKLVAIALSLVLGGAIGNLYDRIVLGYVVDFIDIYVKHWHWPAFNIADSAITLGAVLLAISVLKKSA